MTQKHTPILLDGALGTALFGAGMPSGACPEEWILAEENHENIVKDLARAYRLSGARFLYTPTFGANRAVLAGHGLEDRTAEYNARLAALTRAVAEETGDVRVMGDLSPTGHFLAPLGDLTFDGLYEIYREQISALAPYCDGFVSETNLQLCEARAALLAARAAAPEKPFFATFTLSGETTTMGGTDVAAAAVTLYSLGAAAVGMNCSTGPAAMKGAVEAIAAVRPEGKCILAKPNAGLPDDTGAFSLSPADFARDAATLAGAGADLLGGCCGTSPAYIRALADCLPEVPERTSCRDFDFLIASERRVFDVRGLSIPAPVTVDGECAMKLDYAAPAVHLYLKDEESAALLPEICAYLSATAVCFSAASAAALSRALWLYQGRAAVVLSNLSNEEKENIITTYNPVELKG